MQQNTKTVDQFHSMPARICTAACYGKDRRPTQILVIDRLNGPANILVETISLLLDGDIAITLVDDHADALRALKCCFFDLVLVGLEDHSPLQLTVLPHLHLANPALPVMVVGRNLPRLYKQYARHYGAREVLNMPERASDLKTLVLRMAERYLQAAAA